MSINNYKTLAQELVASSADSIYIVPAGKQAIIKTMVVSNESGGSATIKIWVKGTSATNVFLTETPMGDKEHGDWGGSMTLDAGDEITAVCSVNDAIAIVIFGDEVT